MEKRESRRVILKIYQTPQQPPGYPATEGLPADAQCFIGQHTGPLPQPGETFDRYARTWRIVEVTTPGPNDGGWTFRARAVAVPTNAEASP